MIPVADDVAQWRERAATTRKAAQGMRDAGCRWTVLGIADSYDRMAQMAEHRLARQAVGRASRLAFGLAGLIGGGTGWALGYLLVTSVR